MAERESPLRRLGRLVGGIALMQGGVGHQVLGQLLILDATDLEVAGANAALAATARQRSALGQAAVRTVAPALAAHGLIQADQRRLLRLRRLVLQREEEHAQRERSLQAREGSLELRALALERREAAAVGPPPAAVGDAAPSAGTEELAPRLAAALERGSALERENAELRAALQRLAGAGSASRTRGRRAEPAGGGTTATGRSGGGGGSPARKRGPRRRPPKKP